MAQAFANPIPAPAFMEADGSWDMASYDARCRAYEAETEKYIRMELGGKHKLTGRIIRFQIADGYAPDMMRRHPAMVDLVREMDGQGKVVAAICHAGWMLASAKILQGRTVTSFFAIKDDLIHAGATWIDREVVEDGRLITSRTPDDLPVFMRTVVRAMQAV